MIVVKESFLSARQQLRNRLRNLFHIVFTIKGTKLDTGPNEVIIAAYKMYSYVYLLLYFISKFLENATDYIDSTEFRGGGRWKDVAAQLASDYCSSKTRYFQDYIAMLSMLTILYNI